MKQNRHTLMAKGIMVLLSLLILVFILTFAWFAIPQPDADASGLSIATSKVGDFEYAIGFSTSQTGYSYVRTDFISAADTQLNLTELTPASGYATVYKQDSDGNYLDASDHITTDPSEYVVVPYNLLFDYTPVDVTGDGATLIRPAMNYGNWSVNQSSSNYSIAEANVQYISFDLIFRAASRCTVFLDADSYAKGACETTPGDGGLLNNVTSSNTSTYGSFSRDAIVGAARMAFIDFADLSGTQDADYILNTNRTDLLSTPALLWIPRPDIYLNNNNGQDTTTTGWTLSTGVADNTTFNLVSEGYTNSSYSTYKHYYYDIFNNTNKNVVEYTDAIASSIVSGSGVIFNDQANLTTLSYYNDANDDNLPDPLSGESDGYYYGKVRVRIWLEGYDAEARRALAGGNFSFKLSLSSN